MWRSRVLLPQPLPPMMIKMSPRLTVKLRSRIDDEAAVGHGQIAHGDLELRRRLSFWTLTAHFRSR